MIAAVIRALVEYVGGCGLPVYLADAVPQGLAFPYLTAELSAPFSPEQQGRFTLTLWCAGGAGNMNRMILHDTLMQYFPQRGLCLETDAGLAVIRPEKAKCVASGEAQGIETALDVRVFPHA